MYYPSPLRSLHRRPISSMFSRSRLPISVLCAVLTRLVRFGSKRLRRISSGVARCLYGRLVLKGTVGELTMVHADHVARYRSVPALSECST